MSIYKIAKTHHWRHWYTNTTLHLWSCIDKNSKGTWVKLPFATQQQHMLGLLTQSASVKKLLNYHPANIQRCLPLHSNNWPMNIIYQYPLLLNQKEMYYGVPIFVHQFQCSFQFGGLDIRSLLSNNVYLWYLTCMCFPTQLPMDLYYFLSYK